MSVSPAPSPRARSWPEAAQFNEAVQNLATTISDRELQGGQPELNALGVPMPYAGNFADVYKVHCPQTGNTWAVKFFKREVRDLRERYRAISEQLIIAQLPFMVDFRYLVEGVRIAGAWYPLVKMRWIEGQSLNRFVAQSLGQPKLLDLLFDLWVKLAARLRTAGIAHADLQHGNVVLVPGEQGRLLLKLIDYDGMYVPALAGHGSGELGHANYQHPQRAKTQAFGPELDRFSHLAICCALRCLSVGGLPLWARFNNDENLLFTSQDFAEPEESKLFRELWTLRNPEAHALVGHLALATQRPLEQTPRLEELIENGRVRELTAGEQQVVQEMLHPLQDKSLWAKSELQNGIDLENMVHRDHLVDYANQRNEPAAMAQVTRKPGITSTELPLQDTVDVRPTLKLMKEKSLTPFHGQLVLLALILSSVVLGATAFAVSARWAVHDGVEYLSLPENYRNAIEKLEHGSHYSELSRTEENAVNDMHSQWVDEKKLPWLAAHPFVDLDEQKSATLKHFNDLVSRWGWRVHQRQPFLTIILSLVAFAPAILIPLVSLLRKPSPQP